MSFLFQTYEQCLEEAIFRRDIKKITKYLKYVDVMNIKKRVIIFALKDLDIAKILIPAGVYIHTENDDALINASYDNNLDLVKYLISEGADIHAQDDQALINAIYKKNLDLVKYLISEGADIHAQDDYAIISATEKTYIFKEQSSTYDVLNEDLIKYLFSKGANINAQDDKVFSKLFYMSFYRTTINLKESSDIKNLIKYLISEGNAKVKNIKVLLNLFNRKLDEDFVKIFIPSLKEINLNEIINEILYDVKNSIDTGANILLQVSIKHGHLDLVKYLISSDLVNIKDENLLINASKYGHLHIVEYLLNYILSHNKALLTASYNGYLSIVKCLIEKGNGDVSVYNNQSIIFAVKNRHVDIVKYLIKCGADENINEDVKKFVNEYSYSFVKKI